MICPFCRESADPRYGCSLLGDGWPFKDRVLTVQADAFAIAGYGPQVFPYSLVVTKRHITSLAQASSGERASILQCLKYLLDLQIYPSNRLSVFEHGGRGENSCSCLDHCHLHVIDGHFAIERWLAEEENLDEEVVIDETRMLQTAEPYLLAGAYTHGVLVGVVAHPERRRPQYFRQALASRLGSSAWDWREGMNPHFILELVAASKGFHIDGRNEKSDK